MNSVASLFILYFIYTIYTSIPILWPHDAKSRLIGKVSCWERVKAKREEAAEDEVVR